MTQQVKELGTQPDNLSCGRDEASASSPQPSTYAEEKDFQWTCTCTYKINVIEALER